MGISAALSFPQCCRSSYQKKNDQVSEWQHKSKSCTFQSVTPPPAPVVIVYHVNNNMYKPKWFSTFIKHGCSRHVGLMNTEIQVMS